MALFDMAGLTPPDRQKLLVRVIAPRPIAWVSTLDAQGRGNLAPFSHFMHGGSSPATCAFSPTRDRHGAGKHTLANIEATREYVINVATRALAERVNKTSFEYPAGTDEFDMAGLTRAPSSMVKPARVAESPVALECRLHTIVRVGEGSGSASYIIGEILLVHVDDAVIVDGLPDERLIGFTARAGADRWVDVKPETYFSLPRPTQP